MKSLCIYLLNCIARICLQTLFHVLRKDTGEELSLNLVADCMIVTHHVNAYEEDGHIVMDVIAYDDDNVFKSNFLDRLKKEPGDAGYESNVIGQIRRFVLPLSHHKVSSLYNGQGCCLYLFIKKNQTKL